MKVEVPSHWFSQQYGIPRLYYSNPEVPVDTLLQLGEPEYILFDAIINDVSKGEVFEIINSTPDVQIDQPWIMQENGGLFIFENNMVYDSYRPSPDNTWRYRTRSPQPPSRDTRRRLERSPTPTDRMRNREERPFRKRSPPTDQDVRPNQRRPPPHSRYSPPHFERARSPPRGPARPMAGQHRPAERPVITKPPE